MKWLSIVFFIPIAHAALLSPVLEISCANQEGKFSVNLNEGISHALTYEPKKGLTLRCSIHLEKTSHFSRGPQDVKTVYFSVESCDGKPIEKPEAVPAPFIPGGFIAVSKMPKGKIAQLHAIANSQPLNCKVEKINDKKFYKLKL